MKLTKETTNAGVRRRKSTMTEKPKNEDKRAKGKNTQRLVKGDKERETKRRQPTQKVTKQHATKGEWAEMGKRETKHEAKLIE